MSLFKKLLLIIFLGFTALSIYAASSLEIDCKEFECNSLIDYPESVTIKVRGDSFINRGMIKAPKIIIDAPSITGPSDKNLGKICFTDSFTLNGVPVSKSFSKCK